jgi:hypothetical protein
MSEPIAWMHTNSKQIFKTEKPNEFDFPLFTPLYAHPMRELSDEEIIEISHKALEQSGLTKETNFMVVFARAILKKARDK